MEIKNRQLVAQAKFKWINTMKKIYPDFNHKLWGKNNEYRMKHPQPLIK